MNFNSGIYQYAIAKQTAKGVMAVGPYLGLRHTGGSLETDKAIGDFPFGDGFKHQSNFRAVTGISGKGSLEFQVGDEEAGVFGQAFLGPDAVTTALGLSTHEITTSNAEQAWYTVLKFYGDPSSEKFDVAFVDCKLGNYKERADASESGQIVIGSVDVISATPGVVVGTRPTVVQATVQPYIHNDASGGFVIQGLNGGVSVAGRAMYELEFNNDLDPYQGESHKLHSISEKRTTATVKASFQLDSEMLEIINLIRYGTATPAANAEPNPDVYYDDLSIKLTNGAAGAAERSVLREFPRVELQVDGDSLQTNVDGGHAEVNLIATVQRDPSTGEWCTQTVKNVRTTAY